jgi:hypothetical protein
VTLAEWDQRDGNDGRGTCVGHTLHDDCEVYIGRQSTHGDEYDHLLNCEPGDGGWLGNPFVPESEADQAHYDQFDVIVVEDREVSLARYCEALVAKIDQHPQFAEALVEACYGRTLGCWCRQKDELRPRCHGDVLVDVVEMLAGGGSA